MMKYELRESHGIPAPLLALLAVATGLSVANCYYNQLMLAITLDVSIFQIYNL